MSHFKNYYKKKGLDKSRTRALLPLCQAEQQELFTHAELHALFKKRHGTELADRIMRVRNYQDFKDFCESTGLDLIL